MSSRNLIRVFASKVTYITTNRLSESRNHTTINQKTETCSNKNILWWYRYIQLHFRTCKDMGMEHNKYQQNRCEIYPGKLRYGGTCDPIRVDIFTTHLKEYGKHVCGCTEASSRNLFPHLFFGKPKSPTALIGVGEN